MTNPLFSSFRPAALSCAIALFTSLVLTPEAMADEVSTVDLTTPAVVETEAESTTQQDGPLQPLPWPVQVGDATQNLLNLQRSGALASPTPRPLAGDVAHLNHQRYLDSFKHPIPEKFGTTVGDANKGGQ